MINQKTDLNLARKWRPQTFDTIIGQDVSMRMLKNSLYLKKFFPVYLFAGQRGCGKTSTARVFATAINCTQLLEFQKTPTLQLPCLACASCTAMTNSNHPDFIEIDAASHTGVDNVRSIIESSSYMPLMGNKKIYLIDEAHMLSKAAFNAFLKILEEPPMSVLFVLATTETAKIPPTVLSRCFQLAFHPIGTQTLKTHLLTMCQREGVTIDDAALDVIIDETEGSARDAINLLERVRFSDTSVTASSVLQVLGKISTTDLLTLFDTVIAQNPSMLLATLTGMNFEQRSPAIIWDMLVALCRMLIWVKYSVTTLPNAWQAQREELAQRAGACSISRLQGIMNLFWLHEELFLRTNKKHTVLETVLLTACTQGTSQINAQMLQDVALPGSSSGQAPLSTSQVMQPKAEEQKLKIFQHAPHAHTPKSATQAPSSPLPSHPEERANASISKGPWLDFQQAVATQADQLLNSILAQTMPASTQENQSLYTVQLSSDSPFFKNKLEETKELWLPLLHTTIGSGYQGFAYAPAPTTPKRPAPAPTIQASASPFTPRHQSPVSIVSTFTISDATKWPTSSLILKHFPGKLKRV